MAASQNFSVAKGHNRRSDDETPRVHSQDLKMLAGTACPPFSALPGIAIGIFQPIGVGKWLIGFITGFMWANAFEYVYHRFLLHLPKTFFAQHHRQHYVSVGTPTESVLLDADSYAECTEGRETNIPSLRLPAAGNLGRRHSPLPQKGR